MTIILSLIMQLSVSLGTSTTDQPQSIDQNQTTAIRDVDQSSLD